MSYYPYILSFLVGLHFLLFIQHTFLFLIVRKNLKKDKRLNLSYALFNLSFVITILFLHLKLTENIRLTTTLVLIHAATSVFFTYNLFNLNRFKKQILGVQSVVVVIYSIVMIFQTATIVTIFFASLMLYALFIIALLTINYFSNKKTILSTFLLLSFSLLYISYIVSSIGDALDQYLPAIYGHNYSSLIIISFTLLFSFKYNKRITKLFINKKRLKELAINLDKKVKLRTRKLQKEKNDRINFFINIAHETKTPLTLIKNYLEQYIKKRGMNNDLQIINNNLHKLFRDMEHFLNLEQINKGIFFLNKEAVIHFSDMVYNKVILFKEIARKKEIFIKSYISDEIYVKLDPMAVDRIINNIFENAIKYTDTEGKVEITLTSDNDNSRVLLKVKDNGIGISKEHLKNIFNPYYRVSSNTNTTGMGVGLYITKHIISLLKGKITINSIYNEGTECIIQLPLYIKKETESAGKLPPEDKNAFTSLSVYTSSPEKQNSSSDNSSKMPHILIVEDNYDMSHFLKSELDSLYQVHIAHNGIDALEKIEKNPLPNLIISDVLMEKMGGLQFTETLFQNKNYQHIPVIFLSAKSTLEDKLKGLSYGAVDYMVKPFSIEELKLKITAILEKSKILENKITARLNNDKILANSEKHNLTEKEREIVTLIINGFETKQMAFELNIEETTVNYHLTKIRKKLNVKNKSEIAIKILS